MQCNSPRANIGFNKLAASIAPWVLPAPTSKWISSINIMIWPLDLVIVLRTAFKRSSNSPWYFAPAISAPISSSKIVLSFKEKGTSPLKIRQARPSTIAVLPTPGSPIRTGLFLLLRDNICITRRISSSRPIIGSILPLATSLVKSRPYFLSTSYVSSGFALFTLLPPRISSIAFINLSLSKFMTFFNLFTMECLLSNNAKIICSTDRYSSPNLFL